MAKKLSPWCKRAKIAMIEADLKVQDLSEALDYQRPYVSSVLNGRVYSPIARKKISDFLHIPDADD